MDIVKDPIKKPFYIRYWYGFAGALVLALFVIFAQKYRNVTAIALADELLMDSVVQGDLTVTIRGFGQLTPKEVYWVGAETDGRVERIMARAGDTVHSGDVLVQLVNPQLLQQLKAAELEYDAHTADLRASQINAESQLLNLRAEAANAEIDHQTAKMDLDAKDKLMDQGLEIISRLEHEQAQLTVQKYLQRWETQLERIKKSEEALVANHEAENARLLQTRNNLDKVEGQVDALSIRATVSGIVQEMSLQLGQQIRQGENITRVARPDQLIAELQIQELQVNDIQHGMRTTVDTRTSLIEGSVSRIDPAVVDGSVLVEIELHGQLPREVRPDLNVEGNIEVAHIEETLYVRRPVFARAYSRSTVYKLNADADIADRVPVAYGQASTNYIEILEGLEPGDQIIISDPSSLGNHERILIR